MIVFHSPVFESMGRIAIPQKVHKEEPMGKKLYIGNLPYSVDDQQLQEAFQAYGAVASARVITDRETGRSKGFGFVEMEDDGAANDAVEKMNGQQLAGRAINVSEARPQEPRQGGGGGGGGRGGRFGGGPRGPRGPRY
jgi:RNA recognition motif-containing protein